MKRLFASEAFIVFFLSLLILSLHIFVWTSLGARTPSGKEFIPFHEDPDQYALYTSIIHQGVEGSHQIVNRFVTTVHSGSFVHILYLVIGWVGGLVGMTNVHILYHGTRLLFGIAWCAVILWLCDIMIREKWTRIIAFSSAIFGAGVGVFEAIERVALAPHVTLGYIALVSTIASIFYYENSGNRKWLYRGAASSFLVSIVYPFGFLLVALIVPCYMLLVRRKHWIIGSFVVCITGAIGIYLAHDSASIYPWNSLPYVSMYMPSLSFFGYVGIFGLPLFVAGYGLTLRYKKSLSPLDKREVLLLLVWIIAVGVLLQARSFLARMFGTYIVSSSDYIWGTIVIPLGIFVAWGIEAIWHRSGRYVGIGVVVLLILVAGVFLRLSPQAPGYMYADSGSIQALRVLEEITPTDANVLSLSVLARMIPIHANRSSYFGNAQFTPEWKSKKDQASEFYQGRLNVCRAYTFLQTNHIGAVVYGREEQALGNSIEFYPFLQPWNTYKDTTVYSVVNSPPPGC